MLRTHKYNKAKFYYWWRFRWWRDVWWRDDQIPSPFNSIPLLRDVPHASGFTISIFSLFHNVPTPPFYHGYNYKISTHILCIKQCFCEHPAIHVICFYTKDVFRFQAIARLQELFHARKSLTSATGYDINPKVSLS